MNLLILVVDDEPDVEVLFRQQFRRDLRASRYRWSSHNQLPWLFSASVSTCRRSSGRLRDRVTRPCSHQRDSTALKLRNGGR
jgi:hypothetical protein